LSHAATRFSDTDALAGSIARVAPFTAWPRAALSRLALVSRASVHPSGTFLVTAGEPCDRMTIVVEGAAFSCVSNPDGRRLTYKIDETHFAYGLASLVDGLALQIDLIADGQVSVLRIPHAAVRAELTRMPSLWESISVETIRRSRRYATQLNQFVFDAPQVRAAALLLGLLAKSGDDTHDGPATIDLRLSQERLAELLGTSRQWATSLVRELSTAGLIDWRYGRVTVLDVQALRRLAAKGINVLDSRGASLTRTSTRQPQHR
jgi:CRP-like cAMP-binding protein